jgi:glycerophosphoryl diester phosphodiesterase
MKKALTYAVAAIMACAGLVLILGLFLTGEKTSALSENPKTLLIAHRGYSSLYVENSLKAFEAAGKSNFDAIECDIQVTKDGEIVISHDESLLRLIGVDKVISESTWPEIKNLPFLDDTTQTTATLTDFLDVCRKYQKMAIIEIKEKVRVEDIKAIYDTVKASGLESFQFISFNIEHLISLRAIDNNLNLQFLTRKYSPNYLKTCLDYRLSPSINYKSLTKPLIELFHSYGLKVGVWTVDDITVANRLMEEGVDYLTTNKLVAK